jgi:hypothetical protein
MVVVVVVIGILGASVNMGYYCFMYSPPQTLTYPPPPRSPSPPPLPFSHLRVGDQAFAQPQLKGV